MSQAVLPVLPGLQWENATTPSFETKIQTSVGGSEVRAAFMPYPIRQYTLVHGFLRQYGAFTEMATLHAFFCARQGAFDSFLFDDPSDDTVTLQQIATGNGVLTTFQLGRTIGGGFGVGFFEPIYNTNATPLIYVNGVLKTAGTDYTISATGLITFTVAPGAVAIAWTGTYYWRCRFEEDALEFTEFANLFWAQKALRFRTVLNA